MKWILYNILFAIAYPFLLPGFLLRMFRRGGYAARMGDRFALYPEHLFAANKGDFIWVHAVSVGEVQVAGQLMREWRKLDDKVRFCFSTTSSTGWKMAEREITERDILIYNPLDFPNFVKSALKRVRPRAVVLTESEIWPNFIRQARKMSVPLFLINARVSDRSAPRYRLARWWFGDVFACFTKIFAQSDLDKARLIGSGANSDIVDVTGSFKFDVARRNEAKEQELRSWIGDGKILLGGSTWPGEDEAMLSIYEKLKPQVDSLKLVIAPRHFEKADEIEANIKKRGFACVRRSRGDNGEGVYLADTTGELMGLYGISDVVFVGKSLCAHGSQNMIEPCLCGKPTVVGPYTENFRPVMSDLLASKAIIQVNDYSQLEDQIIGLFNNREPELGLRAREAVERRRGVVAKCLTQMRSVIKVAAFMLVVMLFGCSKDNSSQVAKDNYVYAPTRNASAYVALVEKPDAKRVLLMGDEAKTLSPLFERAGVVVSSDKSDKFDIIVVACSEMTSESCKKASQMLAEDGLFVWMLDVAGLSGASFKSRLESFAFPIAHLWMTGETKWLFVGRKSPRKIGLTAMLDVFTREKSFEDQAAAHCETVANVFANYVGDIKDVIPAFAALDMSAVIVPANFIDREVKPIEWISSADMDDDIAANVLADVRSMQVIRRLVVEGNLKAMAATNKADEEAATDCWARAALRNPDDLFLRERIDRLNRNAKGFLEVGKLLQAMKCYETLILIRPNDSSAVHNFGICLKRLGKADMAEEVLRRAKTLAK